VHEHSTVLHNAETIIHLVTFSQQQISTSQYLSMFHGQQLFNEFLSHHRLVTVRRVCLCFPAAPTAATNITRDIPLQQQLTVNLRSVFPVHFNALTLPAG